MLSRRASQVLAALLVAGLMTGCGSDSDPDPIPPSDLSEQASEIFPAGATRNEATGIVDALEQAATAGDDAAADAAAFDLATLSLTEYHAGRLTGTDAAQRTALSDFLTDAFTEAGLPDPALSPDAFGTDGVVAVADAEGGEFVTVTERAGIMIPAAALSRQVLLVIERLPDSSLYAPGDGPLPTALNQYPLYYEFTTTPVVTFASDAILGLCQVTESASAYYASDPVFARLQIAHPDPANPAIIELLPRVDAPFVECDGVSAGNSRARMLQARRPGIGGRVRKFSPFGAVDAEVASPGVSLSLSPAEVSVVAGASTTANVTIVRSGGFTGPVTIAASGAPAAVIVTGGTIATGATTQVVTIATGAGAAAGTTIMSVTGTAAGVIIAPTPLALTVTAAPPPPPGQIGAGLEGEGSGDQFGSAIALSDDGMRVVIAAPLNNGNGADAGQARVFERNGNTWVQLGADIDGEFAGDRLGYSTAISATGGRVIVGSYLNDGGGTNSGSARVYDFVAGAWTQVGGDINGTAGRGAGWAVAMSASGSRVAVSGRGVGGVANGVVTVYELSGGTWTAVGAPFTGIDELGWSLTMSDDGNRIAFGIPRLGGSAQPGAARVFDWSGGSWTQVGADIVGEAGTDFSGGSISISGDGSTLAIGAEVNIGLGGAAAADRGGHVRVYRLTGGAWTQVGADLDGNLGNYLGTSVSLSGDGTRLMAGGAAGNVVRLYTLTGGTWSLSASPNFNAGGAAADRSGQWVAISADGRTGAVGAPEFNGVAGAATGQVRLYTLP